MHGSPAAMTAPGEHDVPDAEYVVLRASEAGPDAVAAAVAELGGTSVMDIDSLAPGISRTNNDLPTFKDHLPPECKSLFSNLQRCMALRDKYMDASLQGKYEDNPKNWDAEYCVSKGVAGIPPDGRIKVDGCAWNTDKQEPKPWLIYPPPPRPHWEHFVPAPKSSFVVRPTSVNPLPPAVPPVSEANARTASALLESCGGVPGYFREQDVSIPCAQDDCDFGMVDGTIRVWKRSNKKEYISDVIPFTEFHADLEFLLGVTADGPAKTFAWRRLKYLEGKWNLYKLLNEYRELESIKQVPHRCATANQRLLQCAQSRYTCPSQCQYEREASSAFHQVEN